MTFFKKIDFILCGNHFRLTDSSESCRSGHPFPTGVRVSPSCKSYGHAKNLTSVRGCELSPDLPGLPPQFVRRSSLAAQDPTSHLAVTSPRARASLRLSYFMTGAASRGAAQAWCGLSPSLQTDVFLMVGPRCEFGARPRRGHAAVPAREVRPQTTPTWLGPGGREGKEGTTRFLGTAGGFPSLIDSPSRVATVQSCSAGNHRFGGEAELGPRW